MCIITSTFFFFFFKQKTAYEITHSDWSSDVCSSDLEAGQPRLRCQQQQAPRALELARLAVCIDRSEERRVGKECCALWRSWWAPFQSKKISFTVKVLWFEVFIRICWLEVTCL